jgi:NADP-dependent 3-hydroxy acid dehydrogenase YdfG
MPSANRLAIVTGASSGFGAATVRALAGAGYDVLAGARRTDRLEALARETGCRWAALDVTDDASVERFTAGIERLDLLVNNAGNAFGLERIEAAELANWSAMFELNVIGVLRTTRALLPALRASGDATIVNVGSVAAFEVYPGGAGYTASKHGLRALTRTLRLELFGEPIRICEIAPGMAETEFALVRFGGDRERAEKLYAGMTPLGAEDIAEAIRWVATLPSHVNVDELVIRPRDQATATLVHRRSSS